MEKEKKPIYKKWWFWVIIVVIIIAIGTAGSSDNNSKTTLTSSNSVSSDTTKTTTETKSSYKVGEIYEDGSIAIKFVDVDTNFKDYNKYADVKKGNQIIKADFEFENVGSSDVLASAYNFNCYADGYDCEKFWSVEDSAFTSTLSSGKKAKGSVYFEVPTSAKEIKLEYETNAWTSNKAVFIVK